MSAYQVANLSELIDQCIKHTRIRRICLATSKKSDRQTEALRGLQDRARQQGFTLDYGFEDGLHLREFILDNGIVVSSDRGLDLYRRPKSGLRTCRGGHVACYQLQAPTTGGADDCHQFDLPDNPLSAGADVNVQGLTVKEKD